jgi:hypothetical protein
MGYKISGCGVLIYTIHNNEIYYLLGKEIYDKYNSNFFKNKYYNKYNDFGGKINKNELYIDCATREFFEETLGLFGSKYHLKKSLKRLQRYLVNSYYVYPMYVNYDANINKKYQKLVKKHKDNVRRGYKYNYSIEMEELRWFKGDKLDKRMGKRLLNILNKGI